MGPGVQMYRNLTQGQVNKFMTPSKFVYTNRHICSFLCISMGLKMNLNAGNMPSFTAERKKTKICLSLKGGPFDCCDFEFF